MWPEESLSYVQLERDTLDGRHLGLYVDRQLVSVVSWFLSDAQTAQFRKFATLLAHQNQGYGSQLLRYLIQELKEKGISRLWCNARVEQVGFYRKFGLETSGEVFAKNSRSFIIMEVFLADKSEV
ncbi:GNAT family N-acetyltransferase [Lewinellaceae bacterium SD302]|nr:GNAT family N-acetyltransferase [Lewinellaceae bacterium SD302]